MPRHAAFLRAVNVGGRRITNVRLADAVTAVGFDHVATFLASGNIIYDAGGRDAPTAQHLLESGLERHLGFASEVFVRTAEQLDAILDATPFAEDDVAAAATKPQIVFLRGPLATADVNAVHQLSSTEDHLRVVGSELHWLPMKGVGRADLDWRRLDPLIGVNTVRNINTVRRIRPKLD
ncbi:MAG TPA: DUF1697 domain-containing protein [Euzebya sp.]|nr:DUF1697 domain-containing protein [Euzebya sp.]